MMTIQGGMPSLGMFGQAASGLTDTQRQKLDVVLENYDAENLSDVYAKALVEEITDLGIQQSRGLSEALNDVGINAGALAQQAGIGGAGGPPGGGGGPGGKGGPGGAGGGQSAKGPDSAAVDTLQSIVEQLQELSEDSDTDEDFSDTLIALMEDAGLDTSQPIVDFRA